ncbi:TPA: hypothetical protein N0F65_006930 [Lagenidium giganteum]|uniref:Uncharacterized protein n=1 Tax=Lagenidium giganteum TaxID=4803 RepID=A0AAV2ZD37_9STRA|nr:TPA: hypothetical protein N0F65_006930 [Lagenidium giganteum]
MRTPKSVAWKALAMCIVLGQALWALAIPIKNVVVMSNPSFIDDTEETITNATYPGCNHAMPTLSGQQVLQLVQEVLDLSVGDTTIRRKFEEKGDFTIDDLASILHPDQHKTFGLYYGLVLQSSEVLAAKYTPRQETIIIKNPKTNKDTTITLSCSEDKAVLKGMLCTDGITGGPCDDSSWQQCIRPLLLGEHLPHDLVEEVNERHEADTVLPSSRGANNRRDIDRIELGRRCRTYQDINAVYNPYRLDTPFSDDNNLVMPDESTFWANDGAYLSNGKTKIESCATSEMVLGYIYTRRYVIDMVQTQLLAQGLYQVDKNLVETKQFIKDRTKPIFDTTLSVTIGAGFTSFTDIVRRLAKVEMTEKAVSSVLLKRDRAMQGAMLMGSSIRHIWHLCRYPNSFYSYMTPEVRGDTLYLDYMQIGSWHSGFNGMKFDFTRNVMAVIKLSERTPSEGTGISEDWFKREQDFADWYRMYEVKSGGLVDLVIKYFGTMNVDAAKQTQCYQGLLRKIAQVSWIMALRAKPVMNHLVYTAMEAGGDPAGWTLKQMLLDEIVVENPYGYRSSIPYVRTTISPDTGNVWPMIPLLNALRIGLGSVQLKSLLLTQMNATYNALIELEAGNTQFRDVVFCPIGNGNLGVTKNDDKSTMYNKIYPSLQLVINDLIDGVADIHTQMEKDVAPVQVRQEIVKYNRHHAIFNYEGSPVFWQNNALQVGLIRLATKEAPFPSDLDRLKSTLVCYNTLELRYLNVSSKCWNELNSVGETRTMQNSEGLRVITFSTWSMGVVLNIIGAYVAINYTYVLIRSWILSGRKVVPLELALNMDIQSVGVLNLSRVAIMAFGVVPLIVSYHLPADDEFKKKNTTTYPNWFVEVVVALSMTWFVRLGMELGRYCIHLEFFNNWFFVATTRIRNVIVVFVWLVRLGIPVEQGDFNNGILKLSVSCGVSIILGFILVVLSKFFRSEGMAARDNLSMLFAQVHLNRAWHGTLGQSPHGWSHLGLLFEGWEVVRNPKGAMGLVKSCYVSLTATRETLASAMDFQIFEELCGTTQRRNTRHSMSLLASSMVGRRSSSAARRSRNQRLSKRGSAPADVSLSKTQTDGVELKAKGARKDTSNDHSYTGSSDKRQVGVVTPITTLADDESQIEVLTANAARPNNAPVVKKAPSTTHKNRKDQPAFDNIRPPDANGSDADADDDRQQDEHEADHQVTGNVSRASNIGGSHSKHDPSQTGNATGDTSKDTDAEDSHSMYDSATGDTKKRNKY